MGMLRAIHQNLSPDQVKAFFQPGTPLGAYSDLASERLDDHPVTAAVYEQAAALGAQDLMAIGSIDAKWRGVLVGVYLKERGVNDSTRRAQERIGVHLHSAMRLRQTLTEQSAFDAAEAVFEADGTLAHAEGDATSLREMLEAKVREVDRSRARQERGGSGDALDVWQGLVEGRWSLIDRVDTDDRRYYVAVVNPALGVPSRALTAVEAQIVAMAVAGEPNKVIGYALGLPESTVAGRLSSAMKKMGVRSRIDLIRVGRRLLDEGGETAPPASA